MRALLDQGHVRAHAAGLRATADAASATIPATVQEVVLARIDWLPPRRKQDPQAASVIGQSFAASLLAGIVDDGSALGG